MNVRSPEVEVKVRVEPQKRDDIRGGIVNSIEYVSTERTCLGYTGQNNVPSAKGVVNGYTITAMGDTMYTCVIVRSSLVKHDHFTGAKKCVIL